MLLIFNKSNQCTSCCNNNCCEFWSLEEIIVFSLWIAFCIKRDITFGFKISNLIQRLGRKLNYYCCLSMPCFYLCSLLNSIKEARNRFSFLETNKHILFLDTVRVIIPKRDLTRFLTSHFPPKWRYHGNDRSFLLSLRTFEKSSLSALSAGNWARRERTSTKAYL